MDRKIKTRQVHKDIKVLDKTVTVTIGIGKEREYPKVCVNLQTDVR